MTFTSIADNVGMSMDISCSFGTKVERCRMSWFQHYIPFFYEVREFYSWHQEDTRSTEEREVHNRGVSFDTKQS